MKVAILSESPADEAAVRVLVDCAVGIPTELVDLPPLRSRGWPAVRNVLPAVLRTVHYHTDAGQVVVVADANHSTCHDPELGLDACAAAGCRLCELRTLAAKVCRELRPVAGKPAVRAAIGLAVPSIEAWWHWNQRREVSERVWREGRQKNRDPYSRNQLKTAVYGTDRPPLALEMERMVAEAHRIAGCLDSFAQSFPDGFGLFLAELRQWRAAI